ncbi:MAG: succinylglutamate desuccinylase, partial [Coxiella sp. (in: Bacteria)]
NRRENADGHDLNRDYRKPATAETRVHLDWMSRAPSFHLAVCLHEDWESSGFYMYELQGDGEVSLAGAIIEEVRKVCPIDPASEIEEMPASNGVIHPVKIPLQRPEWPEAFYFFTEKTLEKIREDE